MATKARHPSTLCIAHSGQSTCIIAIVNASNNGLKLAKYQMIGERQNRFCYPWLIQSMKRRVTEIERQPRLAKRCQNRFDVGLARMPADINLVAEE